MQTTVKYIPGGMTPLLQPLDSHLNKPLKNFLKEKWANWLENGEKVDILILLVYKNII